MEIEILKEVKEPLLHRRTVEFVVKHPDQGTPARFDIRKAIAELLKEDLDRVYVIKLLTEYGKQETQGIVQVYESKEIAERVLHNYIKRRNAPKEKEEESSPS